MLLLDEKKILADSLAEGVNMKFDEFVRFNSIDLDGIFVDKFFHNIRNDMPIYMNQDMIEYFGYSGILKKQIESVKYLINTNFLEYQNQHWWDFNNKDYIERRKSLLADHSDHKNSDKSTENPEETHDINVLYPPPQRGRGKANAKHLLVAPKLFKEMLMVCQTEKGKQVRRYYIELVDVMQLYIRFQNQMTITSLEFKLDRTLMKLDETNVELKVSNAELKVSNTEAKATRVELVKSTAKLDEMKIVTAENEKKAVERFSKLLGVTEKMDNRLDEVLPNKVDLEKLPEDHRPQVIIMRDRDTKPGECNLYVIRAQEKKIKPAIKKLRAKYGDNIHRSYTVNQPNAIAFWNTVRRKYSDNICKDPKSNWFLLDGITQRAFYKAINVMENERKKK
jgi:hypothetical protein